MNDCWLSIPEVLIIIKKYKDRVPAYISFDKDGNYSSRNEYENCPELGAYVT